ncbi:MAG: ABC transporter ATP-binding protein [Prolixibacteraceae bacterium]|nr:ABC transporter ATP-binding protein [Prolixibacteraceae bacterium]
MIGNNDDFAIRISDLAVGHKNQRGEVAFLRKSINFSACAGETVALIGPNGIGKSTLLQTLAGFRKSWNGTIVLNGRPTASFSQRERATTLCFVSTENVNVPNMHVAGLVALGRFPYTNWLGRLRENDKAQVYDALEKVGMAKFATRMVNQLSDGERQRVLIARALTQDTPFIILDEPTAFLDVRNKYEIFHLLHDLAHSQNKTIILSTHDLNIALREMDKLWILLEDESLEGAPEDAVLHGWIDRLFMSPHIAFDINDGDFYFRKQHAGTVTVTGEGPAYAWTIRALERKGFFFTTNPDADFKITIEPAAEKGAYCWTMEGAGKILKADSVYGLFSGK